MTRLRGKEEERVRVHGRRGGVGVGAVEEQPAGEGGIRLEGKRVKGDWRASRVAVLRIGGLGVVPNHEPEGGGGRGNMDAITVGALGMSA